MSTARHARLVRKIRREEERAARQRAESSLVRGKLVRELVTDAGSQQAAAELLGVSRQAVNKAVQGAEDAWSELQQAAPALTYLALAWPKYGANVVREEEWAALDGEEAVQAAETARDKWDTLASTLETLHLYVSDALGEVTEILNTPGQEEALQDALEEGLKPYREDLWESDYKLLGRTFRPRTVAQAKHLQSILSGMESSLALGTLEARGQRKTWAERT
ncbi:hypothetical protein ACWCWD_29300 [Streptomyces sp. NPDC001493]